MPLQVAVQIDITMVIHNNDLQWQCNSISHHRFQIIPANHHLIIMTINLQWKFANGNLYSITITHCYIASVAATLQYQCVSSILYWYLQVALGICCHSISVKDNSQWPVTMAICNGNLQWANYCWIYHGNGSLPSPLCRSNTTNNDIMVQGGKGAMCGWRTIYWKSASRSRREFGGTGGA